MMKLNRPAQASYNDVMNRFRHSLDLIWLYNRYPLDTFCHCSLDIAFSYILFTDKAFILFFFLEAFTTMMK